MIGKYWSDPSSSFYWNDITLLCGHVPNPSSQASHKPLPSSHYTTRSQAHHNYNPFRKQPGGFNFSLLVLLTSHAYFLENDFLFFELPQWRLLLHHGLLLPQGVLKVSAGSSHFLLQRFVKNTPPMCQGWILQHISELIKWEAPCFGQFWHHKLRTGLLPRVLTRLEKFTSFAQASTAEWHPEGWAGCQGYSTAIHCSVSEH